MAKISTYTTATPAAEDLILGTDGNDSNATKNFTAESIANLAGGGLGRATVRLEAAQINALDTTPVVIVPAPEANKAIQVICASFNLQYTAPAYSFPTALQLVVNGGGAQVVIPTTLVNSSSDLYVTVQIDTGSGLMENGLALKLEADFPTTNTGASSFTIDVLYRIV